MCSTHPVRRAVPPVNDVGVHRRVLLPVYLPAALLGVSSQAALVLLPLYVLELGGSASAAASVVGFLGLGMMTVDIPAGVLTARFGDKAMMLAAMSLIGMAYLGFAVFDDIAVLHVTAFGFGAGTSSFLLARMSYVTAVCEPTERGRVIAIIAGNLRAAALVGPLAGGVMAAATGFGFVFGVFAACVLLAAALVGVFADDKHHVPSELNFDNVAALAVEYRGVFATAGLAAVVFMLMRAARVVLIPLSGAHLGLDTASIGLVVSISAVVDIALFYPAGILMDRRGRRATAVPSSILFAFALAAVYFVEGFYSLLAVAVGAGCANGLSTGIVMTLGTDHAPVARRGEFLGLWRLLTDFGTMSGPMVIAGLVAIAPIGVAALWVAGIGALGSFVVYRFVEETLPPRPATRTDLG